jgi:PAS domain S-box-containing protein
MIASAHQTSIEMMHDNHEPKATPGDAVHMKPLDELELRASLADTRALYELTRAIIAPYNLVELLQTVVDTVAGSLPANRVALITFDPQSQKIVNFLHGGAGAAHVVTSVTFDELSRGLSGWALRELKPALSPKSRPDPREMPDVQLRRAATHCGDIIVVPILYQERVLGTMTAINSPDGPDFGQRQVDLMMAMANHAAIAMTTAELNAQLKSANKNVHFRLALEAAPTGMLMMDRGGKIVLVNAQIEKLFGYPREQLLGQSIEMLVPERFRVNHPGYRRQFFDDPKTRPMGAGRELYGLRRDGREIPIEIGLTPLSSTDGDFVLGSIVDITERQEIERMRSGLISTVSHELRTPLTSISGALGLVQSGALGALPEKAAAMIRIAYQNSGRLVRIINDILDIGKIDAGALDLHMTSVSLADMVRQAIEGNASYAAKYQVRFRFEQADASGCVMADPDRLLQVLANLLSNAAKFSPPDADVLIRVRPNAGTMRVEVEDSGPGIAEEFRGRIFERFAQADSSASRHFEGTGLGLSIARKLVEAMGGTIGFSTVMARGSIFYFDLPLTAAAGEAVRGTQLSDTAAHRVLLYIADSAGDAKLDLPRILHVEDDDDLISVIRATLAGRAEVVPAHSLQDAENLLQRDHFDLVVLDQALPDGSGFELVERIPKLTGRSVPIIILSASGAPAEIQRKVAAVLIKSQLPTAQIATTILTYLK